MLERIRWGILLFLSSFWSKVVFFPFFKKKIDPCKVKVTYREWRIKVLVLFTTIFLGFLSYYSTGLIWVGVKSFFFFVE